MIKAQHHIVYKVFFKYYTLIMLKRKFQKVTLQGGLMDENKALLILANHISWWDGFWIHYLNLKVFKRRQFFMMLEEQLQRHSFFRFLGGFSIKKGSRESIISLNYAAEKLKDKRNLLFMFPQGKINSMHEQNIRFEKGVEYLLKKVDSQVQVVFVANVIDYFSNAKPELSVFYRSYSGHDTSCASLEKAS